MNIANAIPKTNIDEVTEIRNFFCLSDTSHIRSSKSPPLPINDIEEHIKSGIGSINIIYLIQYKNLQIFCTILSLGFSRNVRTAPELLQNELLYPPRWRWSILEFDFLTT
jgi:hypothetical protein